MSKHKRKNKNRVIHSTKQQNYFKYFNHFKTLITFIFVVIFIFFAIRNELINRQEPIKEAEVIEEVIEEEEIIKIPTHVSLEVIDDGYNIYAPSSSKKGYRYGPSIIYYDDGTMDAWFASNANNNEWDWITYRHFDGETWSKEKIVLQPTGNSYDYNSCCDPGVIYFNGYYYIGYTSSIVSTDGGINNNLFVARSNNPDGPYEKWNGTGWGGDPYPIIYYDESDAFWGAGEPSFVIKDNNLYIYYSWLCADGDYTKVAISDLSENWPLSIKEKGFVLERAYGQDSIDVAYIEEIDKFIALTVCDRFKEKSGILIYESDDGIDFNKADFIFTGISEFAHNIGISKKVDGHVSLDDELVVGYGYGQNSSTWGNWSCRFQGINLISYEGEKQKFDKDGVSTYRYLKDNSIDENIYTIGINVDNRTIKLNEGQSSTINLYSYNNLLNKSAILSDFELEYDKDMLSINGLSIKALKPGESEIKIFYKDFYTTCKVICYEEGFKRNVSNPMIVVFKPVQDTYEVSLKDNGLFMKQIRAYIEFENGKWSEAYNDYTKDHNKYPANVDGDTYHMKFKGYDNSIIRVSDEGLIYPIRLGETNVTVKIDDLEFMVHVIVK